MNYGKMQKVPLKIHMVKDFESWIWSVNFHTPPQKMRNSLDFGVGTRPYLRVYAAVIPQGEVQAKLRI
jgi:hypothetical protein